MSTGTGGSGQNNPQGSNPGRRFPGFPKFPGQNPKPSDDQSKPSASGASGFPESSSPYDSSMPEKPSPSPIYPSVPVQPEPSYAQPAYPMPTSQPSSTASFPMPVQPEPQTSQKPSLAEPSGTQTKYPMPSSSGLPNYPSHPGPSTDHPMPQSHVGQREGPSTYPAPVHHGMPNYPTQSSSYSMPQPPPSYSMPQPPPSYSMPQPPPGYSMPQAPSQRQDTSANYPVPPVRENYSAATERPTSSSSEGYPLPMEQATRTMAPPMDHSGYAMPPPMDHSGYAMPPPTDYSGYAMPPPTDYSGYAMPPPVEAEIPPGGEYFEGPAAPNLGNAGFMYMPFSPIGLDASKKRIRITIKMRGYKIKRIIISTLLTFSILIIVSAIFQIFSAIMISKFGRGVDYFNYYNQTYAIVGAAICLVMGIINIISIFLMARIGSFSIAAADVISCFVIYSFYYKAYEKCTQNFSHYLGLAEPCISICCLILCSFVFCVKGFKSPVPSVFRNQPTIEPESKAENGAKDETEALVSKEENALEMSEPISSSLLNKEESN